MPLYSAYCVNLTMKPTGVDIEAGCRGQILACPAGNYKDCGARSMAYVCTTCDIDLRRGRLIRMRPESTPFSVNHLRLSYRDGSIRVRSRCLRTIPLRRDLRSLLPRSEAEVHGEGRPGSDRKGRHRHRRKRRYRQGYMQGTHFPSDSDSVELITSYVFRCFWRRTQRCTSLRGVRHAPRLPSQSYWERPGRRLSGSS